jgi:hypothetical protein
LPMVAHRFLPLLPCGGPFCEQPIVEPATFLQLLCEQAALLFGRIQAVFECLRHISI